MVTDGGQLDIDRIKAELFTKAGGIARELGDGSGECGTFFSRFQKGGLCIEGECAGEVAGDFIRVHILVDGKEVFDYYSKELTDKPSCYVPGDWEERILKLYKRVQETRHRRAERMVKEVPGVVIIHTQGLPKRSWFI